MALLQIPLCQVPEFVLPTIGLSGLLPKFVSAHSYLLFSRLLHFLFFQTETILRVLATGGPMLVVVANGVSAMGA
jgi:hypothetical protein